MTFVAEPVEEAYVKDYDAEPGDYPTEWASRFDMSRWGILVARAECGSRPIIEGRASAATSSSMPRNGSKRVVRAASR